MSLRRRNKKKKINLDQYYFLYDPAEKSIILFDTKTMRCFVNLRRTEDGRIVGDVTELVKPELGADIIRKSLTEENRIMVAEKLRLLLDPDDVVNVPMEVDQEAINRTIIEKIGLDKVVENVQLDKLLPKEDLVGE